MQKEAQKSIWNISLKQFIKSTTRIKPEITGGCVILATANMGLALIIMSLKMSKNKIRNKASNQFLKVQIMHMQRLQASLSQAAERDLEIFDKLRSLPRNASEKQKEPLYHASLIKAIESPLEALSIINEILLITKECIGYCKKTFISDMGSGYLILSSAFHGLLMIAESNMHFLSDGEKEHYTGIKSSSQKTGEYLIAEVNSAIKKSS